MKPPLSIRLLTSSNNERGDLFTRLTKDLFFALGYDDLRLDVHKSGRELDIQGEHRLEPRRLAGECKAHADKMGGAELNKFFGVLTRERKKCAPTPVAGYFISLAGFTETGIEQEIETGDDRVILLDAAKVIAELERSRVIVRCIEAAERAGQCAQGMGLRDEKLDGSELLGHQRGYVWAIFYASGKLRTHVALIHADGTPLAEAVAQEVIDADRLCGGVLHSLRYLAPPVQPPDRVALATEAVASYRQWLGEECGFIHLDGLPADTDLSATRLKLERLFVPLKATYLPKPDDHPDVVQTLRDLVHPIGELLEKTSHLALLAMPGGGKSTLLKRLATAYAFPERRNEVADDLPEREWLPLILRCRELRDRAHRPILELLDDIPRHAGMGAGECVAFRDFVHGSLRTGRVLLLVDGLDEISDEGSRQTFANHLRTFLAMFPQAALVVTSREAGFRLVAGVVAGACEQAKLAPLDEEDVLSLCERWHVEVVGDNEKVRAEAKQLGKTIWDNRHIRTLVENPLLLTTLLVVKRCVRELPRSRTALYREAIRVLVRTWNVEGYDPLDEDEALAQLSYVACAMMEEGKQQIGQKALLKLLQSARRELEAELQFTRISPQQFIERIEYRSSLLMQTGHERIDGVLQPVYEFRHLTFQEYLAARGYVEEQYPGRESGLALADVLGRHFEDEGWREVIPLAAVLAGRKAEELMKKLIGACKLRDPSAMRKRQPRHEPLGVLLHQCIRDEVQLTAPTLRMALSELARERYRGDREFESGWAAAIYRGKFGSIFQEVAEGAYLSGDPGFEDYNSTVERLAVHLRFGDEKAVVMTDALAASLKMDLEGCSRIDKIRAAMVCMWLAYTGGGEVDPKPDIAQLRQSYQMVCDGLCAMVKSDDLSCAHAASWSLAWIGDRRLFQNGVEPSIILALFRLWRESKSKRLARYFAWALSEQPLLPRDTFSRDVWGECDPALKEAAAEDEQWVFGQCAAVVGWYRRAPWDDVELMGHVSKFLNAHSDTTHPTVRELLESFGEAGRNLIVDWETKRAQRQVQRKQKKTVKR